MFDLFADYDSTLVRDSMCIADVGGVGEAPAQKSLRVFPFGAAKESSEILLCILRLFVKRSSLALV